MGLFSTLSLILVTLSGVGPNDPRSGATEDGQAVADALKTYTSAAIAFVPAELISKPIAHNDLTTLLSYPKEHFVVVDLTGAQIKTALERSVLLLPEPNVGFLQVAGLEITFSKSAIPNSRVTAITVDGSKLDDAKKYQVAMPASLQKGQLGYSDIWEKAKLIHSYSDVAMQDVLTGKHSASSPLRWVAQP